MVGNDPIKLLIGKRYLLTAERLKCETGIFTAQVSLGVPEHSLGNIRQSQRDIFRQLFFILGPERTVAAAQLQDLHPRLGLIHTEEPGEPSFLILRVQTVKPDPIRDIFGIEILAFQAFFHSGKVDQIQHMTPVNAAVFPDFPGGIFNSLFHKLKLLDPVLDQLLLESQGVQGKVVVRVIYGHFPDIFQGKSQIFQQQDLLKPGKVLVCIET